jgi:thiol-disulfide isomerase/thioredoxin
MRIVTCLTLIFIVSGCRQSEPILMDGVWRGVLALQEQELAFNFAVRRDSTNSYTAFIKNAGENILLDEFRTEGDTVAITLHIFDAELRVAIDGDSLKGFFVKNYEKNYRIPFKAAFDQDFRFIPQNEKGHADFSGKYRVTFTNDEEVTPAIGVFEHKAGNIMEGTFLTPTGDYRFLEGNVDGDQMTLSTFDGNHTYLFAARKTSDSTMSGDYWSGKTWHQTWTATRDKDASLPDPDTLTHLNQGFDKIYVSFPDVNGNRVSLSDEKYHNKVVILQLFGTWCPNCLDETRFLAQWYKDNKARDIAVIGLAYEAKDDFDYASSRVKKMIGKLGVTYDFVIAGTKDKAEASKTLPMLNRVVAFPTTIFVGRDGRVKKIHTGFEGPGTGIYYDRFVENFNETINELLGDNFASINQ